MGVRFDVETVHRSLGAASVVADAKKMEAATRALSAGTKQLAKDTGVSEGHLRKAATAHAQASEKAAGLVKRQEMLNRIMRETGASAATARKVIAAYGSTIATEGQAAIRTAAQLNTLEAETRQLTDAQRKSATAMSLGSTVARNLTSQLVAMTAGVVGVRALFSAVSKSVGAFENQARVTAQVEARLRSTGNVVGITGKEIKDFAGEWQRATGIADEETQKLAAQLITFRGVNRSVFFDGIKVAQDMAMVWDKDVRESALQVFKALEDPIRGMTALRRSGSQLSETEEKLARNLVETGRVAEAQGLIIKSLQAQYGGAAEAARQAGGSISALRAEFGDFSEVVGGAVFEGGGRGLTEWVTSFIRSSREIISSADEQSNSLQDVSDKATMLAEFYVVLSSAARTFLGAESMLTKGLEEGAASLFRAAAGAKKYVQEVIPTLAATQRYSEAADESKKKTDQFTAAVERVALAMEEQEKVAKAAAAAIASFGDRTQLAKTTAEFMTKFKLSADAAGEAAKLKLTPGVNLADKAIVALIGSVKIAEARLQKLAKIEPPKGWDPFAAQEVGPPIPPEVEARMKAAAEKQLADMERAKQLLEEIKSEETKILEKREEILKNAQLTNEEKTKLLEKLRVEVKFTSEETRNLVGAWDEVMDAAVQAARNGQDAWATTLLFIADNMDSLISGFSMLGDVLTKAGRADLGSLVTGISQFAAGDISGGIGSVAQGFGLTGGGFSQFGGRNERNFIAEGAALGAQYGGAYGAIIGAFAGAFIKGGADDLHAGLEELRGRADFLITEAQGELAEVGAQVEQLLEGFFNNLQDSLSADLDFGAGKMEFHIREDRVRVVVNGIEKVFNTIEEAIAFAAQGVLAANATAEGLGENMRALFESLAGPTVLGDLSQLQDAINLASQLDMEESGVTGTLIKERQELIALGAQYGLSLQAIMDLENRRIETMKKSLDAQLAGVYGVQDVTGQFTQMTSALESFNKETQAEIDARKKRLEEIEAEIAAMATAGTEGEQLASTLAGGGGSVRDTLAEVRDGAGRLGEGFGGLLGPSQDLVGTLGEGAGEFRDAADRLRRLKEEAEALRNSLTRGSDMFGADQLGQLWTTAVDQVATSLIGLIQAIRGDTARATELEEIRNRQFAFTLLAQIQQAQLLLATMQGVSAAVRGMLEALISDAQEILEGLATGDITLPTAPTRPTGGRADRKKQEQEEAARAAEDFNRQVELMTRQLGGATQAEIANADALAELVDKGAKAKMSVEEVSAAVSMLAELQLRDLAADWVAAAADLGKVDLKLAFEDVRNRAREALRAALVDAAANPEAYRAARDAIRAGMAAELAELGKGALTGGRYGLRQAAIESARSIQFLMRHLDQLGLTANQVARNVQDNVVPELLGIIKAEAERTGDKDAYNAALAQEAELERILTRIKLEGLELQLRAANALTPALQGMFDTARALLNLPSVAGTSTTGAPTADTWNPMAHRIGTFNPGAGTAGGGSGGAAPTLESLADIIAGLQRDAMTPMERLAADFEAMMDRISAATGTAAEHAQAAALAQEAYARAVAEAQEQMTRGLRDLIEGAQQAVESRKSPVLQLSAARTAFEQARAAFDPTDEASVQALEEATRKYLDIAASFTNLIGGGAILATAQAAIAELAGLLPGAMAGDSTAAPFAAAPTFVPATTATLLPPTSTTDGSAQTSVIEARLAAIEAVLKSSRDADERRWVDGHKSRQAVVTLASQIGR